MTQAIWLKDLASSLREFLARLRHDGASFGFAPALRGVTPAGARLLLGPSCLAAKTHVALGLWNVLSDKEKQQWIEFLQAFQYGGEKDLGPRLAGAFVDDTLLASLRRRYWRERWSQTVRGWLGIQAEAAEGSWKAPGMLQRAILSETKQAIATLAEVGAAPRQPFRGFPLTADDARIYLASFDWTQPWAAGAHFAIVCVFAATQSPLFLSQPQASSLIETLRAFSRSVLDPPTGAYFMGPSPAHGSLVNGAMKVLSGLDWIDEPIHEPERLIDTCLAQLPRSEGCHLVDAVYVLHRCLRQTSHRRDEIRNYCAKVLDMIHAHYIPEDGGFSYNLGRSQTHYYGVPITQGLRAADIHGTALLVWALAMIHEILEAGFCDWRVNRP